MIKRRFGEEFHASVAERLEVRQTETRKAAGDRKRKVVKGGKRQQREGKQKVKRLKVKPNQLKLKLPQLKKEKKKLQRGFS